MKNVINVEENYCGFNKNKLIGAFILKNSHPLISVPFVAKNESPSLIEELCRKTNLENRDNGLYFEGKLITKEMQKSLIINALIDVAKEELNNDDNNLYISNMVKTILKEEALKNKTISNNLITEADLIKNLYGVSEEEVGIRL